MIRNEVIRNKLGAVSVADKMRKVTLRLIRACEEDLCRYTSNEA